MVLPPTTRPPTVSSSGRRDNHSVAARWDTDQRGRGVADAAQAVPAIEELENLARTAGWVAEEPEAHLLPGLRDRLELTGLTLESTAVEADGVYRIRLASGTMLSRREIRRAVWSILGGVAELSTFVAETASEGAVTFEAVTGIPPGGRFATHGHTLRIEVLQPG